MTYYKNLTFICYLFIIKVIIDNGEEFMVYYQAVMDEDEVFETSKNLYIVNCGYDIWGPQDACRMKRVRPDFYLLTIIKGKGIFRFQGNKYTLESGSTFLYFPNEQQDWTFRKSEDSCVYWVHFIGDEAYQLLQRLQLFSGLITRNTPNCVIDFYTDIFNEFKVRNAYYEDMANGLLIRLLTFLARSFKDTKHDDIFINVIDSIIKNPLLTNDECAEICHFSTTHFIRLFKEKYKITPLKYKQSILISKAKDLLANTTLSVTEISIMLGFENNPLYFNKLFKTLTKMTPVEFRKLQG